MINKLKKFWSYIRSREAWESSLDGQFRVENEFINANEEKAKDNLQKLGWNILSIDTRIAWFSFKIQKGEHIHTVSLREALEMK